MTTRLDAAIRSRPEIVGVAALFFGFALFFLMPGKLASAISAAVFFVGFFYGLFSYSKLDTKGGRRVLAAVTAMCLAASIGIGYVTF